MNTLKLSQAAEKDIDESAIWYDKQLLGLSLRFIADINSSFALIRKDPTRFSFYNNNKRVRKKSLKKFPFRIFYLFKNSQILILAIIHYKRSNTFIRRRLQ